MQEMSSALQTSPHAPTPPIFATEDDISRRIRLVMSLRSRGIRDTRTLSAIEGVPRELFVDATFRDHAYDDTALPIACGQTISQPSVVAWMTAALDMPARGTVLEIGTGSGYQAAILAQMARRVYTMERHPDLLEGASARFKALGISTIVTRLGDGSRGWKEAAPFDRILVTAAAPEVPAALIEQLRPGGVMVLPVGPEGAPQMLLRLTKDAGGTVHTQHLMDVRFVPLVPA